MVVNVDEKEEKLRKHLNDVLEELGKLTAEKKRTRHDLSTITISDTSRTNTASPMAISYTLSRHSLDNDKYPVRSESSKSGTIHSAAE